MITMSVTCAGNAGTPILSEAAAALDVSVERRL